MFLSRQQLRRIILNEMNLLTEGGKSPEVPPVGKGSLEITVKKGDIIRPNLRPGVGQRIILSNASGGSFVLLSDTDMGGIKYFKSTGSSLTFGRQRLKEIGDLEVISPKRFKLRVSSVLGTEETVDNEPAFTKEKPELEPTKNLPKPITIPGDEEDLTTAQTDQVRASAIDFDAIPKPGDGSTDTKKVRWGQVIKYRVRSGVGQEILIQGSGPFQVRSRSKPMASIRYYKSTGNTLAYGRDFEELRARSVYKGKIQYGIYGTAYVQVFPTEDSSVKLTIKSVQGSEKLQPEEGTKPTSRPRSKPRPTDQAPKDPKDLGGWRKYARLSAKNGELAAKWIMSTKGDASHFDYFKKWYMKYKRTGKTGTSLQLPKPKGYPNPVQIINVLDKLIARNFRLSVADIENM